ncbi:MAG: tetratricopeptide repeat protein [Lewinellaceae bacterium]|nr:tetratricopeptide repeat protein [Lewinellaceae bacterium]
MLRKGFATFVLTCYFLPIWGCAQNSTLDAQLAQWRVLLSQGAREQVIDSCNRLLHQAPGLPAAEKAAVLTLKASALRLEGQPDAALALHQQALRLRTRALGAAHESVGNSYLNIGNCYLEMGRNPEALQALEHSRRILERRFSPTDTNLIAVYTSLGESHRLQRRYTQAAYFWNNAAQIAHSHYPGHAAPVISATLNCAALHSETGRFDSALVLLQTARAAMHAAADTLQTRYIRVLNLQATAYARLGFPEQAIPLWKRALQLGDAAPDCPNWLRGEIRYNLGQAQLDLGDLFAAELNLQAALPFFAGEPFSRSRVWNGLGLAARYGGDPERAVACFTEALNANFEYGPEYAPAFENAGLFRNLAGCYLDQKQFQAAAYYAEKALAMLRKLPNTGADQAACMLNLARAAQQSGDYPTATQWLKQVQTKMPPNDVGLQFALHYQSGQLAMAAGHYPQALDAFRNVLAVLPVAGPVLVNPFPYETVQAYAAMADCYRLMARQDGGQATWKTALDCVRQAVAQLEDLKGHFEAEHSLPEAQHTFSRLFDLGVEASLALADPVEAWRWSERFKSNFQQQLAWRALHWSAPASLPEQVAAVQHARKRLAYFQQLRYRHTFRADPGLPGLLHLPAGLDDSIRYWAEQCRQLDRTQAGAHAGGLLAI